MTSRPRRKIPAALRDAIFERDGHVCVYCQLAKHTQKCLYCKGRKASLTLDHVVPHVYRGSDTAENLVTSCACCNGSRGVTDIDLFAEWLRRHNRGDVAIEARVLKAISKPLPTK